MKQKQLKENLKQEIKKLKYRLAVVEGWIDKWEGIGKRAYNSGWAEYRILGGRNIGKR
jgi:hypothetical protein